MTKGTMFFTAFMVAFVCAVIVYFAMSLQASNTATQKTVDKAGWIWRMKDHDGYNIWSKCQGENLIYMDDHDGALAVVLNGCKV